MPLDNLIHCSPTIFFYSVFHLDQMNILSPLNVPKIYFGIHIIFFVNQRTKVTQAMQQDFKVVPSIPHYVQTLFQRLKPNHFWPKLTVCCDFI